MLKEARIVSVLSLFPLPQYVVVLEDAEKGVLAAREAGMSCIAVPTEQTRHHDFSQATRVCSSLNEITLELIDSLSY